MVGYCLDKYISKDGKYSGAVDAYDPIAIMPTSKCRMYGSNLACFIFSMQKKFVIRINIMIECNAGRQKSAMVLYMLPMRRYRKKFHRRILFCQQ